MSEYTETPWLVVPGKAFIYALDDNGVNRFQASIDGAHCPDAELAANARHIVHCVNNYERLVGALREVLEEYEDVDLAEDEPEALTTAVRNGRILLIELEAKQ